MGYSSNTLHTHARKQINQYINVKQTFGTDEKDGGNPRIKGGRLCPFEDGEEAGTSLLGKGQQGRDALGEGLQAASVLIVASG